MGEGSLHGVVVTDKVDSEIVESSLHQYHIMVE